MQPVLSGRSTARRYYWPDLAFSNRFLQPGAWRDRFIAPRQFPCRVSCRRGDTHSTHKPQRAWKVDSEKGAAVAGSVTSTVVVWHQQSRAVKLLYFPFLALRLAKAKQQNLKEKKNKSFSTTSLALSQRQRLQLKSCDAKCKKRTTNFVLDAHSHPL